MNKKELEAFAKQAAKSIKSEADFSCYFWIIVIADRRFLRWKIITRLLI
jgi:hypothetical protein